MLIGIEAQQKGTLLLGNEAVAQGLLDEGATYFAGYPGTPSTEIIEYVFKTNKSESIVVHWSSNEAVAFEEAAAAAISGEYAVFTAKHVGLNVAADPFMTLAYMGVRGAMVICVADDPSMHSSQNEQDTRWYGRLAHLPVLEPTDPENAYEWARRALQLSYKIKLPVILRLTTRVSHGLSSIKFAPPISKPKQDYTKDPSRFVSLPSNARKNKLRLNKAFSEVEEEIENPIYYKKSLSTPQHSLGIISAGTAASYCEELQADLPFDLFISYVTHPLPKNALTKFMQQHSEILVVEELDPVIEGDLKQLAYERKIETNIVGKQYIPLNYELGLENIENAIRDLLGLEKPEVIEIPLNNSDIIVRPPTFCAGCPHRATYYDLNKALKHQDVIFSNDIGCYSLGALPPFNDADSLLCMGASIGMAVGYSEIFPDKTIVATIGDSTFWHSGVTALSNAIWHNSNILVVVMDNSTTAMTGTQENPSTNNTLNILETAKGMGALAWQVNSFENKELVQIIREKVKLPGVKVLVAKQPCVIYENHLNKEREIPPKGVIKVDMDKCTLCELCVSDLNCSALSLQNGEIIVDGAQCNGCEFCATICPRDAFSLEVRTNE